MPEKLSFGIEKFGSVGWFCEPFSEGTKINLNLVTEVYVSVRTLVTSKQFVPNPLGPFVFLSLEPKADKISAYLQNIRLIETLTVFTNSLLVISGYIYLEAFSSSLNSHVGS